MIGISDRALERQFLKDDHFRERLKAQCMRMLEKIRAVERSKRRSKK